MKKGQGLPFDVLEELLEIIYSNLVNNLQMFTVFQFELNFLLVISEINQCTSRIN